jgi:hypothetical protein
MFALRNNDFEPRLAIFGGRIITHLSFVSPALGDSARTQEDQKAI